MKCYHTYKDKDKAWFSDALLREGFKKKIVEFSTKGGGVSDGRFSTKKKKNK